MNYKGAIDNFCKCAGTICIVSYSTLVECRIRNIATAFQYMLACHSALHGYNLYYLAANIDKFMSHMIYFIIVVVVS